MYKMVGRCGDGGQRLDRKSRGQGRMEESREGSQSPSRAVELMIMMIPPLPHLHSWCVQGKIYEP